MIIHRRHVLLSGLGALLPVKISQAEQTVDSLIKLIVSYPPGGPSDIVARVLGRKMEENIKRKVLVENRPGANGLIAGKKVADSNPNGGDLLLATTANSSNPFIYKNMPFDTEKDFTPLAMISSGPVVLWASVDSGINSLSDLLLRAKKNPGEITFGSSGIGGTPHLAGEMLKQFAGIDMLHIPYQGTAPLMTDLVGGRVDLYFGGVTSTVEHYRSGKVVPIATTEPERTNFLPEVPTFSESGIEGFEFLSWFGIFGPKNMNEDAIKMLNDAVEPLQQDPEFRESLKSVGMVPRIITGKDFIEYFKKDMKMWGNIVKKAGIEPS